MAGNASRNLAQHWSDQIHQLAFDSPAPWLRELRERASAAFGTGGLPHRKVEAWKYTPMRLLESRAPSLPAGPEPRRTVPAIPEPLDADAARILFVDGAVADDAIELPDGVRLLTLEEALVSHESHVRDLAQKVDLGGPAQAFAALNTAYIDLSRVLHIRSGVDAGRLLLQWVFSGESAAELNFSRLFLLLDEGARIELVEQFESGHNATGALNVMIQARLGAGAQLGHVRLQGEDDAAVLLTSTSADLEAGSRYSYFGFDLGGALVRHELGVELAGGESECNLAGACVLDGRRHGETRFSVDHAAPGCRSEQYFRGVLGGRSRGVFNGRALIRPGADASSVRQSNANLLLSPLAEMDTKPELEIYADEVEASHGATVGQLDDNAVFYLRSRGLSEAEARRLLTVAFCHTVADRLEDRKLAERIAERVERAMPSALDDPEAEAPE